jgi:ABC-type transporter Mla maintaining outer membrane lipid asymmetry ATPase subunit MlaF
MTAALRFEELVLSGSEVPPISFAVGPHEVVAVTGDAGTGVLRLGAVALGLEPPAAGRSLVYGHEVTRLPRHEALAFRRRVGYVPEGDGLLQNLSLADNVALPLRFGSSLSPREIESRLRVMLAAVRLTDAAALRPAAANDEQRRRAALARALAFDPELVILAQPFDGIGGRAAAEILEMARGGDTAEGARRAVFLTGQLLPERVRARVDTRYRIAGGSLRQEP